MPPTFLYSPFRPRVHPRCGSSPAASRKTPPDRRRNRAASTPKFGRDRLPSSRSISASTDDGPNGSGRLSAARILSSFHDDARTELGPAPPEGAADEPNLVERTFLAIRIHRGNPAPPQMLGASADSAALELQTSRSHRATRIAQRELRHSREDSAMVLASTTFALN
jgi:hypothetical protein